MNHKGNITIGMILGIIIAIVLYFIFIPHIKVFLYGFEPGNIPEISNAELNQIIRSQPNVMVYFYHHLSDSSVRMLMPGYSQVAEQFDGRLKFYRYKFLEAGESLSQKVSFESYFTVYKNGNESANFPVQQLAWNVHDNRGLILKMLSDYFMNNSTSLLFKGASVLSADNFNARVLNNSRPVFVYFMSETCPACQMYDPQFKNIAEKNSQWADFYLLNSDLQENHDLVKKYNIQVTPTIILFKGDSIKEKIIRVYNEQDFNEACLLSSMLDEL